MNEIGESERIARLDDLAQMKAGLLTLEMVKQRAIERQSGLSKSRFQTAVALACGRARAAVGGSSQQ